MPPPNAIGRYEIRSVLGRGGMAVVWEAWDPVLQRMVALKAIEKHKLEHDSPLRSLARLKREAQAAARLVHPNIVAVYEYGEDDAHAFIAMERVSGRALSIYLEDEDFRNELNQVREIIAGILDALAYSHSEGVVHRDIKPSNILISREGFVKVTDFGIARLEVGGATVQGNVIGTPYYMSPEQYRGQQADWRTDLFSTGVILYQLVTGEKPFPGNTSAAVMHRVLMDEPVSPSLINAGLPQEIDAVVLTALAKDPQERFQSAREFLQMLDAVLRRIETAAPAARGAAPAVSESRSTTSTAPPVTDARSALRTLPSDARLSAARRLSTSLQRTQSLPKAPAALSPNSPAATPPRTAVTWPETPMPLARPKPDADRTPMPQVQSRSRPLRIEPTLTAQPPVVQESAEDSRARILFVDDEERILTALRNVFRSQYQVVTETRPMEALKLVQTTAFPVVVSDQRMPDLVGVEFLRQVRDVSPGSVRILLTGYSDLAAMVGSINDGEVYRFISKPWDTQEIQAVMAEAVSIGKRMIQRGASAALPPPVTRDAILVVGQDKVVYDAVTGCLAGAAPVSHAEGITEALEFLRANETAVIVADVDAGLDNYLVFLNVLKRERPEVLVIALTFASDSEYVMELINAAQIYRFLNKPVNFDMLDRYLRAAIAQHEAYRAAPELLEEHTVHESQKAIESTIGRWIRDGLRSLRGKFGRGRVRL